MLSLEGIKSDINTSSTTTTSRRVMVTHYGDVLYVTVVGWGPLTTVVIQWQVNVSVVQVSAGSHVTSVGKGTMVTHRGDVTVRRQFRWWAYLSIYYFPLLILQIFMNETDTLKTAVHTDGAKLLNMFRIAIHITVFLFFFLVLNFRFY